MMTLVHGYLLALVVGAICCAVVQNPTKLSSPKLGMTAVQGNDKIYLAGGYKYNDFVSTNEIEIFELSTMQLNGNLPLNHSRGDITALNIPPNIYFVGGNNYINRPLIYRQDLHNFEEISDGPTVRNKELSLTHNFRVFDSTLSVVGDYSIDFYNLTSDTWHFNEQLTSVITRLDNECVYSAGGYVFVIGGYDIYAQASSTMIYVYDIQNDILTAKDILQDKGGSSCDIDFVNGVMVYRPLGGNGYFVAYQTSSQQWIKKDFPFIIGSATVGNTTLVFNETSIYNIDWQSGITTLTDVLSKPVIIYAIGDYVSYWNYDNLDLQVCAMQAPLWTQSCFQVKIHVSMLTPGALILPPNRFVIWSEVALTIVNVEFMNASSITLPSSGIVTVVVHPNEVDSLLVSWATSPPKMLTVPISAPSTYTSQTVAMTFDYLVGSDLVSLSTGFVGPNLDATNPMNIGQYSNQIFKYTQDGDRFFLMRYQAVPQAYQYIDVYNYENRNWSDPIPIPSELAYTYDSRHNAGILEGKIILCSTSTTGYYDIDSKNWTVIQHNDVNLAPRRGVYSIEVPLLTINNVAYLRPYNALYFNTFDLQHIWSTTRIGSTEGYGMDQHFVHENLIFVSTLNAYNNESYALYNYDLASNTWDAVNYVGINDTVSIAKVGDYLAFFDALGNTQSFYMPNKQWEDMPVVNYTRGIRFSVAIEAQHNNKSIALIAGGEVASVNRMTDVMFILTDDGIHPTATVQPINEAPSQGPSAEQLSGGIIAAIVVPICVVAIASVLLAILLVRCNKKKRRNGSQVVSMTGLEAKYGDWFTPFSDITFGRQLGQGASGQVFEGTYKSTKVALKVSSTQANSTVISELELMIKLRPHPNVVQLLGFSVHPETQSIILIIEYCNQGSLASTIHSNQDLSMEQKMSWLIGISKGLSHLHANNIVHRDLAARNVMLHQGEAKITDFGMSRLIDEQKQHGTTKSELGPIRWMAPESLKNKTYSMKTDVWSFGILMFEVIAQQEPHTTADPIEIGRQIRDEGVTPTIPSSCPTELSSLMKECWHMNAEQRPSVDELIVHLEEIFKE